MSDADTLAAILDAHEPGSHAEVIALIHARGMLRDGAEPAAVSAALEAQREYVRGHDRTRAGARRRGGVRADGEASAGRLSRLSGQEIFWEWGTLLAAVLNAPVVYLLSPWMVLPRSVSSVWSVVPAAAAWFANTVRL